MIDQPDTREILPSFAELEQRLESVLRVRKSLAQESRHGKGWSPHFNHIANNALSFPMLSLDTIKNYPEELKEGDQKKIANHLALAERYFALFEDPWFAERELQSEHGAFSDGKVFDFASYIPRAEKLLAERHAGEMGLA